MAEKKPKRASGAVLARVLRNSAGATSPADLEARLHDLRPLQPSAEYVAAANQAMGRAPQPMGDVALGAGYDLAPVQREAPMDMPANAAEAVALLNQQSGRPGVGPQVVADMADLERTARAAPLNARKRVPAFQGAVASGAPDPRMLAALLRAGR